MTPDAMPNILDEIVATKHKEVAAARLRMPLEELEDQARTAPPVRDFRAALAGLGVVRVLSYQVARCVAEGELRVLMPRSEPEPLPVQFVQLPGAPTRAATAFVAFALRRLRARLSGKD